MKLRSIIELTPLLDIFLILIFAFMIKAQSDIKVQKADVDMLQQEITEQRDSLASARSQISAFRENLDSSEIRTLQLEAQLIDREVQLKDGIHALSEKLSEFFGSTELELGDMVEDGELSDEDFQYFRKQISQFTPSQNPDIIRKVYTLTELEAYTSVFDVYLNEENEVELLGESTGIVLRDYDEEEDRFPASAIEQFGLSLSEKLEDAYRQKERSKERLGDVVMITFGYSNSAMRGAIKLTDRTIDDFYKELDVREKPGRKVFYAVLGYYPKA